MKIRKIVYQGKNYKKNIQQEGIPLYFKEKLYNEWLNKYFWFKFSII